MTEMPEAGRQAAHVFLDAISGGIFTGQDVDTAAVDLAVARLNEINAVEATLDDADNLTLDISDLVGGIVVAMGFLVNQVSLYADVDAQEVVIKTREFLDEDA
jgi:hypothetical protein